MINRPPMSIRYLALIFTIMGLLCGCVHREEPVSKVNAGIMETSVAVIPATGTSSSAVALPVITNGTIVPSADLVTNPCACTPTVQQAANTLVVPTQTVRVMPTKLDPSPTAEKPPFDQFVEKVKNGNPAQVVGVYMEDIFRLRVVQQPPNQPNFVSPVMGVATQFLLAFKVAGNIGLLAHNYLSGQYFFFLTPGYITQIINGDGNVTDYEVAEIYEFQALSPTSPTSDFIDLDTNQRLSASALFNKMYMGEHHLTFQTCIAQGNQDSWGRLFVVAYPL